MFQDKTTTLPLDNLDIFKVGFSGMAFGRFLDGSSGKGAGCLLDLITDEAVLVVIIGTAEASLGVLLATVARR